MLTFALVQLTKMKTNNISLLPENNLLMMNNDKVAMLVKNDVDGESIYDDFKRMDYIWITGECSEM